MNITFPVFRKLLARLALAEATDQSLICVIPISFPVSLVSLLMRLSDYHVEEK